MGTPLSEQDLGQPSEAFYAVDVHGAFDEFVVIVIDTEVAIAEIDPGARGCGSPPPRHTSASRQVGAVLSGQPTLLERGW